MNNQKLLESLGFTVEPNDEPHVTHKFILWKDEIRFSAGKTKLQAWNSIPLDANFCFQYIVPKMLENGFGLGIDFAGRFGVRFYDEQENESFGEGDTAEEAICTAYLKFIEQQ